MEIPVATYTFAISTCYSLFQFALFLSQVIMRRGYRSLSPTKLKQGCTKGITLILSLLNIFLFASYNIFGSIISYSKGYTIIRSKYLTTFERALQILEISFESLEKSILFLSLILFLPILKTFSTKPHNNRSTELIFIVLYSITRSVFYPLLYSIFYTYPMLGIYFVEIMNISESILLLFIYFCINRHVNSSIQYNSGSIYLMNNLVLRFKFISKIYFLQLFIEILYKTVIITLTLVKEKFINQFFIEVAFLFRMISFSLQCYAFLKLAGEDDKRYPQDIFWTPGYNEDMFFEPYEDERFVEKIGVLVDSCYNIPNGRVRHVEK